MIRLITCLGGCFSVHPRWVESLQFNPEADSLLVPFKLYLTDPIDNTRDDDKGGERNEDALRSFPCLSRFPFQVTSQTLRRMGESNSGCGTATRYKSVNGCSTWIVHLLGPTWRRGEHNGLSSVVDYSFESHACPLEC